MATLVHNVNPNMVISSHPGSVGSVGVPVVRTRYRTSTPDQPWRYDPYWTPVRSTKLGSNVQNGDERSYVSHGGPAKQIYANWPGNNSFRHQYGETFHNVQCPDLFVEPMLSSLGDFSWRRKVARVNLAKRAGRFWGIMPHGYAPPEGAVLRGGNYPTSTTGGGDFGPAGAPVVMTKKVPGAIDSGYDHPDKARRPINDPRFLKKR